MKIMTKNKERKELTVEEIINVLLYSVIIVMPFIVTRQSSPLYVVGKVNFLYIIGIMVFVLMIKDNYKKMNFKKANVEMKIALVFLFTILISSIFAVDKRIAFSGNYYRREGFFMFCVYIILFIASMKYFELSKVSLKVMLIVSDFMALYGIAQFWGLDVVNKFLKVDVGGNHSMALIGNRNFLSTYLLIFIFISVGAYIYYKESIYLIISMPLFGALLCTLTRGGWIGFMAFSFSGLIFILKRKECLKRAGIVFCIFFLILVCINSFSGGRITGRASKSTIVNEAGDFVGSAGSRLNILNIAFESFKSSPLIGSGPDNMQEKLMLDFSEELGSHIILYGESIDKAHNEYLEYAASCGIFTLITYLLLIGCIFKGLIKNIEDDRSKIMIISLIGYLVQAFFNISVIMVAPLYWIMLGVFVKFTYDGFKGDIKVLN